MKITGTKPVLAVAIPILACAVLCSFAYGNDEQPVVKIVQDTLQQRDSSYFVTGSVYNPNEKAAKNVLIRYRVWKKWMGKNEQGQMLKETGGVVSALIKYLPPKQIVEFVATGSAPVLSNSKPDPIEAEITAEWADAQ